MLNASMGSIADLTRVLQDLPDLGTISTTPSWDEGLQPDQSDSGDTVLPADSNEGIPCAGAGPLCPDIAD